MSVKVGKQLLPHQFFALFSPLKGEWIERKKERKKQTNETE